MDRSVHAVDEVQAYVDQLVAMTVAERLALGYMHPGRADVIDAGALIASAGAAAYDRGFPAGQ